MKGTWIDWKMDVIRNVTGDKDRLITVGHNALLALLPSNNKLDFVSGAIQQFQPAVRFNSRDNSDGVAPCPKRQSPPITLRGAPNPHQHPPSSGLRPLK